MAAAIEFANVSLALDETRLLLADVSFALAPGTSTALLGRSGSGKTTLLRMVNRLALPTSGQVRVGGSLVSAPGLPTRDILALRRNIGYVIQETGLFPHLSIARNVSMLPELAGTSPKAFRARAAELLSSVGLDPALYQDRLPHQLSGGQRQRVGLARALAAQPAILLMDEPFGALDPLTRADMQDMLKALLARLQSEGNAKTVLLVTHDLDEATYLADRILLMEAGRVVADLAPAAFLASPHPLVQAYVRAFHRSQPGSPSSNVPAPTPAPDSPGATPGNQPASHPEDQLASHPGNHPGQPAETT